MKSRMVLAAVAAVVAIVFALLATRERDPYRGITREQAREAMARKAPGPGGKRRLFRRTPSGKVEEILNGPGSIPIRRRLPESGPGHLEKTGPGPDAPPSGAPRIREIH